MYYAYIPGNGIEYFDTAAEAQRAAEACLEDMTAEAAGDEWDDDIDRLEWGELKTMGKVRKINSRPDPSGRFSELCEYEMVEK